MRNDILEYLRLKLSETNGGCTIPSIMNNFGVEYSELRLILNDLHKKNKIHKRLGISGVLIYYKK